MSDRKGQKLVLFLFDVDDFDKQDHATGDHALQLIANTRKRTFRGTDFIVRWGGDEFIVILPCTDELGMGELKSRLLAEFNALSRIVSTDVSVSVGYSVYPDEGYELDDLIKIADRKMYEDKRGKDNQLEECK